MGFTEKVSSKFHRTEELIEDIRNGKMVILVDDEDRENEGDLVCAADHVTPEMINFMATEARGLICLSLTRDQVERLNLSLMVKEENNQSSNKTAFTVSIEAATGVSTGISAADRSHTIRVASSRSAKAGDVHTPGHIFPIRAQLGGVLKRTGHTEGSVDLATLAGLTPAAVICEVMNPDGTMARVPQLREFAERNHMKIGTIVDLVEYRLAHESLVEEVLSEKIPEKFGPDVTVRIFRNKLDGVEHLVLQKGKPSTSQPTLVRVHVENPVGDLLSILEHRESNLDRGRSRIMQEENGVFVLLRGVGASSSILQSLKSELQPNGERTANQASMDQRDYGIGAQILRAIGLHQIKLLSNRPERRVGLKAYGIEIVETLKF